MIVDEGVGGGRTRIRKMRTGIGTRRKGVERREYGLHFFETLVQEGKVQATKGKTNSNSGSAATTAAQPQQLGSSSAHLDRLEECRGHHRRHPLHHQLPLAHGKPREAAECELAVLVV